MRKYKLSKNRLFIYICTLYTVGFLCGVFLLRGNKIVTNQTESNFLRIFFNNYWYILLMWLFGFSAIGLILNTIIIYFRGFLFGVLFILLISTDLNRLGVLTLLELFLFIPAFFTLSYISLSVSLTLFYNFINNNQSKAMHFNKYLNLIFVITILIIIYSLLVKIS